MDKTDVAPARAARATQGDAVNKPIRSISATHADDALTRADHAHHARIYAVMLAVAPFLVFVGPLLAKFGDFPAHMRQDPPFSAASDVAALCVAGVAIFGFQGLHSLAALAPLRRPHIKLTGLAFFGLAGAAGVLTSGFSALPADAYLPTRPLSLLGQALLLHAFTQVRALRHGRPVRSHFWIPLVFLALSAAFNALPLESELFLVFAGLGLCAIVMLLMMYAAYVRFAWDVFALTRNDARLPR